MATIFTKIIKGEIPSYKVAENEKFYAFLDIRPKSKGHTLVVPKTEIDYFFDLSDEQLSELMIFAKGIARAIDRSLSPTRTGIIVEGLEVPHAHLHLIPIYPGKGFLSAQEKEPPGVEEMKVIAKKIEQEWISEK